MRPRVKTQHSRATAASRGTSAFGHSVTSARGWSPGLSLKWPAELCVLERKATEVRGRCRPAHTKGTQRPPFTVGAALGRLAGAVFPGRRCCQVAVLALPDRALWKSVAAHGARSRSGRCAPVRRASCEVFRTPHGRFTSSPRLVYLNIYLHSHESWYLFYTLGYNSSIVFYFVGSDCFDSDHGGRFELAPVSL